MFGTAVRHFADKPKTQEATQTISRAIFEVVKEHGPLTVSHTWERLKEMAPPGLTDKRHMKVVLRWMRSRQKLRQICNRVGPHKQFLYTTWFTKPNTTDKPWSVASLVCYSAASGNEEDIIAELLLMNKEETRC